MRHHDKRTITMTLIARFDRYAVDLNDLETFAAVARTGTMTRAAEQLATVQSNVTARIRLLERELGAPLFHREARGVSLTSAGQRLLPYAERVGELVREARRALADDGHPRGPLVVGSLETTAGLRLPPVLAAYAARYPDVDLTLRTGTTAELVGEVLGRRLEAALVAGPVEHPELCEQSVLVEELVVATAPGVANLDDLLVASTEALPRRRGRRVGAQAAVVGNPSSAATDLKLVLFRRGCSYRERFERYLADRGISRLRVLELGTLDGILGCVAAGLGVTLLPRAVFARHHAAGSVALHPLPPELARVETVLVRRHDAYVSPALARFVDCCVEIGVGGPTAATR
jgi:DNA-binding transcriptional LysR family regulator